MQQTIIYGNGSVNELEECLLKFGSKKFLLVCDKAFQYLSLKRNIEKLKTPYVTFDSFTANPLYEQVREGVGIFNEENCDAIVAVGGGSAIDVAKCIKLYCRMDTATCYLKQEYRDSKIPLIAIPTTAGTGSESTRFAVIYYNGQKQSVAHDSIVPDCAILDSTALKTLPVYQRKCTTLDALCQGIESWWSVNSTDESKEYSEKAVKTIIGNYRAYVFDNDESAMEKIMLGANYSGRSINITQTTAAHAMSYKLTSLYGLPHGHAVAICLAPLWEYMMGCDASSCVDKRGINYVKAVFNEIASALNAKTVPEAIKAFKELLSELEIGSPVSTKREEDLALLTKSVNVERLKNNPITLTDDDIFNLYSLVVK